MSQHQESKPSLSVLEASLLSKAPAKWGEFSRCQLKRDKGKPKWQRELPSEGVSNEEIFSNLHNRLVSELVRINTIVEKKDVMITSFCSTCGDVDRGNKLNGKPWCFKCNLPLKMPKSYRTYPDAKMLPQTKRIHDTFRRLDE